MRVRLLQSMTFPTDENELLERHLLNSQGYSRQQNNANLNRLCKVEIELSLNLTGVLSKLYTRPSIDSELNTWYVHYVENNLIVFSMQHRHVWVVGIRENYPMVS